MKCAVFTGVHIFCSCDLNHVFDPWSLCLIFRVLKKFIWQFLLIFLSASPSSVFLPQTTGQESGVEVLRQGIATVFGKLGVWEDAGLKSPRVWMPVSSLEQSREGGSKVKRPWVLQSISWFSQPLEGDVFISSSCRHSQVGKARVSPCELNKGTLV